MMTLEEQIFSRHLRKQILLDSNLLLVLVTGIFDTRLLGKFKRVAGYTGEDHTLLVQTVSRFGTLLTTPHLLTEVGNLANNSFPECVRADWSIAFAGFLQAAGVRSVVEERWIEGASLALRQEFPRFGITDAAVSACACDALVLTQDYRLSGWLRSVGVDVLNFQDLRSMQHAIGQRPHD